MKIEKTDLNAIADQFVSIDPSAITKHENGDHVLNVWKDENGQTKVLIQAGGMNATLLTLAA